MLGIYRYTGVAAGVLAIVAAIWFSGRQAGRGAVEANALQDTLERTENGQEGATDAIKDLDNGLDPSSIVRQNSRRW